MKNSQAAHHDSAIDLLRFVAILAVVLIHTTTRTLEAGGYSFPQQDVSLFLNQIFRFASPLFFAVSGFVLELAYPGPFNPVLFYRRRLGKILLPYIFWSAIYYFFVYRLHTIGFIHSLLLGNASYQLYFIPAIFLFYLLFPLIHRLYSKLTRLPVLVLLGAIQLSLLAFDYYSRPLNLPAPISAVVLNYYVFLMGIVAARNRSRVIHLARKFRNVLVLIIICLSLFIFFEGRSRYLVTSDYLSFYSTWRPDIMVYTVLLGWLLYGLFSTWPANSKFVKILSGVTFFIFFSHVVVLEMVWKFVSPLYIFPGFDIFYFLIVSGISLLLGILVRKVSLLSGITG